MAKKKIKPILPSLREKKRYVAFQVIIKNRTADFAHVSDVIHKITLHFLGQLGAAKAGILVLGNKWFPESQKGIARVGHRHVDAFKAALALGERIQDNEVIIRSIGVSGILRKAEGKFITNKTD